MRVLVCGTGFGRVYLRAVQSCPDLDLVGVLSRGSAASRAVAAEHQVPCYTAVDDVPVDEVDIACVVVPTTTGAGDGSEVARRFLERGVHVLQESPLLPEEIAAALRTAQSNGVRYHVSTLYPAVEPVRRFLDAAQTLREQQQPLFVDAACGLQVLYSTVDLVTRTAGAVRPWRFADPSLPPSDVAAVAIVPAPYTAVHGVVGGVPLTLRVQNELEPSDPDNHALLLHRLSVGFEGGVLTLADTHGPVLWSPRLHSTRDSEGTLVLDGPERLGTASTVVLGGDPCPAFSDLFTQVWPRAVESALNELREGIADPALSVRHAQSALGVSTLWHDLSARLGPPTLVTRAEPRTVSPTAQPTEVRA